MMRPRSDQFGSYFRALHGYEPFPWQARLAATILETGNWPNLLDVPTGLGKTSAIDIALFVLAARPDIAPRRMVMVVDRRVVVDQAADHARKIQKRLSDATEGPLAAVASALRALWSGSTDAMPFEVAVLRGGMPRDEAWAHRPDRPVVALSTVDQVGSRLLFRGYGVSPGMAPVHAGLLGNDALILLDEVQLSTAFADTLRAIDERWRPWRERDPELHEQLPNRWAFVRMSATPVGTGGEDDITFGLNDDDLVHPVVVQRRNASKLAALGTPIVTNKNDTEKTMSAVVVAFSSAAEHHLDGGARRIVVIVNRVATAREIHEHLKVSVQDRADVVLLTGRMRPLDRIEVFGVADDAASVAGRVTAGSPRGTDQRPVIVVSTQTIEAGADFDFDALITECASVDALRQRFGRLDRRGQLGETRATILVRKDQASDSEDDPVYGAALARTWTWLEAQGGEARIVDFGLAHFPALPLGPEDRAELCSPVRHAPVMLPAHLDAWAQTNPRGEPDPDIALWLHGPKRGTTEVRVVWRADIESATLNDHTRQEWMEDLASASLAVAPPSSLESISIPIAAFRAWIAREPAVELADVEGADRDLSRGPLRREEGDTRAFLIASKAGAQVCRDGKTVYPEATIVIPSSYGGIRDGNWNPDATDPVRDLGDWAQLVHRGRPVVRLTPALLEPLAELANSVPTVPDTDDPDFKPRDAVRDWLVRARDAGSNRWRTSVDALLHRRSKLRAVELGNSGYYAAVGQPHPGLYLDELRRGADVTSSIVNDDDDSASHIGKEVGLEQHLGDVERWARTFARNIQLPDAIGDDLAIAARLHDIGKADPRFQQMLHGGSSVRAAASRQLLAKSRGDASDRAARQQARQRAGYPAGYRHELLSVAMLRDNMNALSTAHDPDLVLHLVGSHHGWCRPFAPALGHGASLKVDFLFEGTQFSSDAAHGLASLDSGVAERYWLLTERYGWWTLAWFETLVRLADHRASEESANSTSLDTSTGGESSAPGAR